MSKIKLNKSYNSSLIIDTGGKWTDFEGFQGSEVELFLKDKLEDAVVDFEYHSTGYKSPDGQILNNVLVGLNAFGKEVCYKRVINADPTYTADFEFLQIIIGANLHNSGNASELPIQVNKTDTLAASAVFKYILTGNIAGSEFNETSALSITFKWFKDKQGTEVDATLDTITRTVNPGESIVVDITKMYDNSFAKRYLGAVFTTPKSTVEIVKVFDTPFTLRKLELSYGGPLVINTPILTNIVLNGTDNEDLSNYELEYFLDGTTKLPNHKLSSGMANQIQLPLGNISEGAHDVYLRARSGSALTSNYIQVSFIYLKETDSALTDAVAMISEVPNEINNCNLSKFFKVITTSHLSGNIEIIALKSSSPGNIINIKTFEQAKENEEFIFKEISLNLLSTDDSLKIDYTSYIEIPGNEDSSVYLKILVKDGKGTRALNFYTQGSNSITRAEYKVINIVNPKEGSTHLQYSPGEILSFSQISNGNVFLDLNKNLDSSDGLLLENVLENTETITMTAFKVSPTTGVFETPKKLLSAGQTPLHRSAFSIEMMFKTYGISDLEDKIMTIGNITLCPKHIFVNHEPDKKSEPHHTVNASRADFRKETIQHVMITYDPEYKPSTYDLLYDKFFTTGSTSYTKNAKTFPCLKFYVNGTINRIISIEPSTICGESDFKMQIHPTNSNINYYIFRTYDRTLNYEEVKKNYISSMSKLENKKQYYLDNDILYLSTDYPAGQLLEKSKILNTISLGKCINKFRSVSNPGKIYTDRKVLLLVLPDDVLPPYYGNRKDYEPKATFLVHYPEVLTNNGYVPAAESGRLSGGKVKALGSSAKKYMFHNTSYSKFTFTPESEFKSESPTTYNYYKMPGSDIKVEKLVGKVNYASSMQSHKQGATKLFHEAYVGSGFDTSWMNGGRKAVLEDDFLYFFVNVPKDDLNNITWDYFKQEDGTYNFENCYFLGFQTWGSAKGDKPTSGYDKTTPHYLMLEGADNDNASANFKTPWASLQIWGNYKNGKWSSADSTIIELPTNNPENGKNYYHQFSGGTKDPITNLWTPDYQTGLLIKDETIVFDPGTESGTSSDKRADAWDVAFGCTEGDGYYEKGDNPNDLDGENLFFVFEDSAIESVNRMAQFYNLVYTFDFSSLIYIKHGTTIDGTSMVLKDLKGTPIELPDGLTDSPVYQYKLLFGADCTININGKLIKPKAGEIYRWEKAWPTDVMANSIAKWVPAGLYHNGTDWESLNIADICNWYRNAALQIGTYPSEYAFFSKEAYERLKNKADGEYKYLRDFYEFGGYEEDDAVKNMQACMAEAFKIIAYEFLDVNDISYHQAFIKLVAGTDNRAKNTYFQIVGPIYTDKAILSNGEEVSIIKTKDSEGNTLYGYIKDNTLYKVNISNSEVTETEEVFDASELEIKAHYYKKTDKGDFKIRLYQDDLDTIFKTDNNGQLVKPYYLLEPPYNRDLEELWGDMHSGFFYNYDLTFVDDIKTQLSKLLVFATGNEWPDTPTSKFHLYFFSIQKNIPSIAYNHLSEIYYESTQTLWLDGLGTPFYEVFRDGSGSSWKDFTNNKVYDPVSLSHGSCLEAEIEYLRDRVLLLSTYTNTAKKQTDTHILLNGGSATTQGSEVIIKADYTSFILYIYPIINNIESTKNYTSLQYDPILDYISWDNTLNDYSKNHLVYNIALPNEKTDLFVKFDSSGLTSNSYWTSTDLYRTINIKSGTNSFSSLFKFPNASTVISLDPEYKIESAESKELEVVDYLESIEHLVLQSASITSSGLDFTGCNRLKTLVLGSTESNLTDSPDGTPSEDIEWYAVKFKDVLDPSKFIKVDGAEASTGFKQVILPKSNSLELVILPNCITVANINYYPNLSRFEFNDGTKLSNLTIDGRNPNAIIEYILTNFVGTYTTTVEITNIPDNFWLSETTCKKIAAIKNVKLSGTINIGDGKDLTEIDWTTKRVLVEKFGNIDSGNTVFKYKKVSYTGSDTDITVNAIGLIESSGVAPITLTIKGNDVPIESDNKHLKITYSIIDTKTGKAPSSDDIRFVDNWTPQLIIKEGLTGVYKITTKVYYTSSASKSLPTTLNVGFYAPKVGDFAYANGSFSSVFDLSLGLVGVVFYSHESKNAVGKSVYDVRVLSASYSSTDMPLGPSSYALNFTLNSSRRPELTTYKALLEALGLDSALYVSDVVNLRSGDDAGGTIYYNLKWDKDDPTELYLATLPNTIEHENQKNYINRANLFIDSLRGLKGMTVRSLEDYGWTKPTAAGKANFNKVVRDLKNMLSIDVGTISYKQADCGGFLYGIYPAFLSALYYEPDLELQGKGITYFGVGNWYVPDSRELERLIYYRINSSITDNATTENYWNKTKASTNDVSGKKLNIFTDNAFANIDFLKDTQAQISSVGTVEGEGLTYGLTGYYGDATPIWGKDCYDDWNVICARDVAHNISPVCRIELTEP